MKQDHPIQKIKNIIHKIQSFYARKKYGDPQKDLVMIGVTGTDGKTTVTSMIYHILKSSGLNAGFISTINAKVGEKNMTTGLHVTTPDPWLVPQYLKIMKKEGAKFVILESTSNGLHQNRLDGIDFDSALITNIKYDHLDYHGSWENYASAKFMLIEKVKEQGYVVLNKDDMQSAQWINSESNKLQHDVFVKWCSKNEVENYEHDINGIRFRYMDQDFAIPIIGEYNLINTLQVINLCLRYTDISSIAKALRSYNTPEGRMQIMQSEPFGIIVDFAHTPQALDSALKSIQDIREPGAKVINVFGCAGKRDKGRRKMGAVSTKLADITILTAEDPRDEKLYTINNEIIDHAKESNGKLIFRFESTENYNEIKIDDLKRSIEESIKLGEKPIIAFDADDVSSRKDAIDLAIKLADEKDIVFVTGKGHEKSLAFGKREIEYNWSDQKHISNILK